MSYYNLHKLPRINFGKVLPVIAWIAAIVFFGAVVKSCSHTESLRQSCNSINTMFNKTEVSFNDRTEECTGYIRGELHTFELSDNDTVNIKRKVVKVNYDYGK